MLNMQAKVSLAVDCSQLHIQYIYSSLLCTVTTIHILKMHHTVETRGMLNVVFYFKGRIVPSDSFCIECNSP